MRLRPFFPLIVLLSAAFSARAGFTAQEVMQQVFPRYIAKHQCWLVKPDGVGGDHAYRCMRIAHVNLVRPATGERLYVLASGDTCQKDGTPIEGDATSLSGKVAAFVAEKRNDKPYIVAKNTQFRFGSRGAAPSGWTFQKLGKDYWGWTVESGQFQTGRYEGWQIILAPRGSDIVDLSGLGTIAKEDDSGMFGPPTSMKAHLEWDMSDPQAAIYPIRATVAGDIAGKKIQPKTYSIPFDEKRGIYPRPDWALK